MKLKLGIMCEPYCGRKVDITAHSILQQLRFIFISLLSHCDIFCSSSAPNFIIDCSLQTDVEFVKGQQHGICINFVCTLIVLWTFSQLCHNGDYTFDKFQSTAKVLAVKILAWILMLVIVCSFEVACLFVQLIDQWSIYELLASPHFDWSEPLKLQLWQIIVK